VRRFAARRIKDGRPGLWWRVRTAPATPPPWYVILGARRHVRVGSQSMCGKPKPVRLLNAAPPLAHHL
jgi:hypothetical protein